MSNKILRFLNTFKGIEPNRQGKCIPYVCETLDGKKGAACCKLDYVCPSLKKDCKCILYEFRPINCLTFPRSPEDLKLVRFCSYTFK